MQRNTSKIVEKGKCREKRTMPCFSGLCPFCAAGVDALETCGGRRATSKIGLAHTRTCHTDAGQKLKLKQLFQL